ncbi:ABC transporter ATP-binding protein/permease [Thauera sinica]|uniref:ABC transporter ATP-binding protein/permease n=1 Tax=Thauera sinica TaxID=2665146 RepID=A0ABW1AL52_9RHOO|nr:ABC transporter ATP-binding protein/permease [Thauera sp. K11]
MSVQDANGRPLRFFHAFARLAGPYWTAPGRWRQRLLTLLLALLVVCQVGLAIRLNLWNADLFDALERRSTERAMEQILVFVLIVLGSVAVNTLHLVVRRWLQLDWRRWLTGHVVGHWMVEARHYQAALIPGDHANPDGRIAEDIRIATEAAFDLANSLFYCVLLLVTFVDILWSLSGRVEVAGVDVPGYLVFLAIAYAGVGSGVAFMLGRPLVRATDTRQTREADFRFGLVRARELGEAISLARGESVERGRLGRLFETIVQSWHAQSASLARLLAFSSAYTILAPVFPILVSTPRFLGGLLTLGGLMQSAQAFQQVTAALSWPVDNLPRLAEWRASVERVLALEEAVRTVAAEAARSGDTAINLDRNRRARLGVRDLWIASPDGTAILPALNVEVLPGEHVLVDGDSDAAAALFRVLAGIWPWGRGDVALPADDDMIAVGTRPFLPQGTLRDALVFPRPDSQHVDALLRGALGRVGLRHLAERLDEHADWARVLSGAEQQRLSIARLLLNAPGWVVLGGALDALDPASADEMLRLLSEALPHTGAIVIGPHPGSTETFARRLTLQRLAGGEVLLNEVYAQRQAARKPRPRGLRLVDWLSQGYGS